jgi:multidrug transporter EmrE-like cation transporter
MAVLEKKPLTLEVLESQTALELPERETPATAVISCVAVCIGQIQIKDIDVGVAANICANVGVLATALNGLGVTGAQFNCRVSGGGVNQQ